ncbi:MAG: 50S ribosomal protein L6 [Gammaproteobacteria bacterium]|nr:50S ribosomal protein L6 [Gammaproteobacteria bacterium]
MSRVSNKPITIPSGVTVAVNADAIAVKGPKGEMHYPANRLVKVVVEAGEVKIAMADESKEANTFAGTARANLANMVLGVSKGFEKKLVLVGVGYRAKVQGSTLSLTLGFSHPVEHALPKGITAEVPIQTEIMIKGVDKQLVGQVASDIRGYRPPEPYKGKGVRYSDEKIKLKEAKKK